MPTRRTRTSRTSRRFDAGRAAGQLATSTRFIAGETRPARRGLHAASTRPAASSRRGRDAAAARRRRRRQPTASRPSGAASSTSSCPSPESILDEVVPASVQGPAVQVLPRRGGVSEQIARMVAMKAATENADDMIKTLSRAVQPRPPVADHHRAARHHRRRRTRSPDAVRNDTRNPTYRRSATIRSEQVATTCQPQRRHASPRSSARRSTPSSPRTSLPAIYNAVEDRRSEHKGVEHQPRPARCSSTSAAAASAASPSAPPTAWSAARTCVDTGAPVTVPVGKATLGRVFNLLGEPIDGRGPVDGRRSAGRSTATPPAVRRPVAQDRAVRDRHQGHRPADARSSAAARPACSAAPAWARRSSSRS